MHALAIILLTLLLTTAATTASADGRIDAKLQCQVEYGSQSEMGAACQEGVNLANQAATKGEDAASACVVSRKENGALVTACQQGVTLYSRFAGQIRSTDKSGFSYTWQQPKTGFQVDVGDYQASLGNQKAIEDCLRAFEGSDGTPSCMSGITIQPQAPAPVTGVGRQ